MLPPRAVEDSQGQNGARVREKFKKWPSEAKKELRQNHANGARSRKVHFTNAHAFFTNPRQPMACTDTVSDVNNALHKAEDEAAPVITLEYGPYMN